MNVRMTNSLRANADQAGSIEAVGSEVRALRKARGLTLNELSRHCGISLSHLSAIERGAVNPSMVKIQAIADGLGVPVSWFFNERPGDGPLEQTHVVRSENRRHLNKLYGEPAEVSGFSDWLLSSTIGGAFHLGLSDYAPGPDAAETELVVREGEVHGLVTEGEMVLQLEDEVITLRAGDSFSIPGDLPHWLDNKSDKPARIIWVNAPLITPGNVVRRNET